MLFARHGARCRRATWYGSFPKGIQTLLDDDKGINIWGLFRALPCVCRELQIKVAFNYMVSFDLTTTWGCQHNKLFFLFVRILALLPLLLKYRCFPVISIFLYYKKYKKKTRSISLCVYAHTHKTHKHMYSIFYFETFFLTSSLFFHINMD